MAGYWIQFISRKENSALAPTGNTVTQKHFVRYSTPSLGFSVEKEVDEEMQRLVQVAFEAGKEAMKNEIHELLRLR